MIELLDKYKIKGHFEFSHSESLEQKCNAPTGRSGVYLIYETIGERRSLIYIGSSGQRNADGSLKTRRSGLGGMKDRLVNGYHPGFGKVKRKNAWPTQMKLEGIQKIIVFWWVTYDDEYHDFPTDIEGILLSNYKLKHGAKPRWHA